MAAGPASRERSSAVRGNRVIRESGAVDPDGLRFAENVTLKSLKSVLDREQELGTWGMNLAGRECE